MKKVITLLLVLTMMAAVFAGCGAPQESTAPSESTSASEPAPSQDTSAPSDSESASEPAATESAATGDVEVFKAAEYVNFVPTELSKGKTFGVSVQTHANPFFYKEVTSVEETLKDAGATVLSPDPAGDLNKQVEDVTEFVTRGVDAIIIDPIDSEGVAPALEAAKDAGIPVIIIDMALEKEDLDLVVTCIESDNVNLGYLAGKTLVDAIGGEGDIAILDFNTIKCVRERVEGLKQAIEEAGGKVNIVAQQNVYGVVEDAQAMMDTFMQSNPNLKGVFCINDPTAQGCVAAVEAAGKTGEIAVVSVDGSQNGIDMIKDGQILSSPVQFPAILANKAVEVAEMCFAGKQDQIASHMMVACDNITKDNAAEYDGQTY